MTDRSQDGWGRAEYTFENGEPAPFSITICGRDRWALECLLKAGGNGCTPIDTPGPRWFGYFRTRQALIRLCATSSDRIDPCALAALATLPEWIGGVA